MAKFVVGKGIDEYLEQLRKLSNNADDYIGKSVYEGAKIVADAVRREIQALPIDDDKKHKIRRQGIETVQKEGLLNGFGISKMGNDNGFRHVKIGFDGYNGKVTKKYKNGQPNVMIARSLESGTSFSNKNPFVTRAVKASKGNAEKEMKQIFEKEIEKIMK